LEILNRRGSVVHGEQAAIWIGLMKAIFLFGVVVVFGNDLKRVSVECDEVVEERRSGRLKESGGARETCRDGLLGHDLVHHQYG
jgi:hypothetical protein